MRRTAGVIGVIALACTMGCSSSGSDAFVIKRCAISGTIIGKNGAPQTVDVSGDPESQGILGVAFFTDGTVRNNGKYARYYRMRVAGYVGSKVFVRNENPQRIGPVQPGKTMAWVGAGRLTDTKDIPAKITCKITNSAG